MHHPKGALLRLAYGESVAQQVEHNTFNVGVLGSSPSGFTKIQTVLYRRTVFCFHEAGMRGSHLRLPPCRNPAPPCGRRQRRVGEVRPRGRRSTTQRVHQNSNRSLRRTVFCFHEAGMRGSHLRLPPCRNPAPPCGRRQRRVGEVRPKHPAGPRRTHFRPNYSRFGSSPLSFRRRSSSIYPAVMTPEGKAMMATPNRDDSIDTTRPTSVTGQRSP